MIDDAGNITVGLQKTSYELVGGSYSYVSGVLVERIDPDGNYLGTYNLKDAKLDTIKRSKTGAGGVFLLAAYYSVPLSDSVSTLYEIIPGASLKKYRLKDFANGRGQQDFTTFDGSLMYTTGTLLSEEDGTYSTNTVCIGNGDMRMATPESAISVQVFPQPFGAFFTFYAGEATGVVRVLDISGRPIQTLQYTGAPLQVMTADWSPGSYMLHYTSDLGTASTSLIKL